MQHQTITTDRQLQQYCRELADCKSIAFDTEFVSEHTYRPVLCLVQVAAEGEPAVIDAVAVDRMQPFWETIAEGDHETIVHAGRSEMEFCLEATGRLSERVFDVQLAAGLAGFEYPASYNTLVANLLGERPHKHETRTDWRRRPLSKRQIQYALDDVLHLHAIRDVLHAKLKELGRLEWLAEETAAWGRRIELARSSHRWRRTSGIAGLNARTLAIVRELFNWRESEAQRRDCPVRRVLRDDLIVELAKRGSAEVRHIRVLRGMERGDLHRRLDEISDHIQRALDLPEDECPKTIRRKHSAKLSVLGQFLFAALGSIARELQLAPGLVGTPEDIRELVAYRTHGNAADRHIPKLAQGWRAELIGRTFDDLLAGKTSVRIADVTSDHPLTFE